MAFLWATIGDASIEKCSLLKVQLGLIQIIGTQLTRKRIVAEGQAMIAPPLRLGKGDRSVRGIKALIASGGT